MKPYISSAPLFSSAASSSFPSLPSVSTCLRPTLSATHHSEHHFIVNAQLLSQATSSSDLSLTTSAANEAEQAIAHDPSNTTTHILKALVLNLQGYRSLALDLLDTAPSPLEVESMNHDEKGNVLLKRAELRTADDWDGVTEDVAESTRLIGESPQGIATLGIWYEKKGLKEEARLAGLSGRCSSTN